jgi:Arc/MetJ-type ribon-helix-helix transcriptional regulator
MASTINIQLTDHLRKYVDSRTSDWDVYSTPSEYLRDLIRKDMEQRRMSEEIEIAELLIDARNSPKSPFKRDFFEKERARLKKANAQKKKPQ